MITTDHNNMCAKARAHYYEYLDDELRTHIPGEMAAHLDTCQTCQSEVKRLKSMLTDTEQGGDRVASEASPAMVTNLKLHFAHLGTPVGCTNVKPFLPSMAVSTLTVTVPTPITVHIDRCERCAHDLETIRRLNLSDRQLYRLGQFLADTSDEDHVSCQQAQDAIPGIVAMSHGNTDPEVLRHLRLCGTCRKALYQHRQTICRELPSGDSALQTYPCDNVLPNDIFEYCLPYEGNGKDNRPAKDRSTLTDHIKECPHCLTKIQELHNIVCSLLERRSSGITTRFSFRDDEGAIADGTSYVSRGWDVEVQTADEAAVEQEQAETAAAPTGNVGLHNRPFELRRLAKPVAVAAAIVLAVALIMNGPAARAVDLARIYEALERATNVYMAVFYQEETEPVQETWVSRDLNVKILKAGQQYTLWDIGVRSVKTKSLSTNSITTSELDNDTFLKVKATMSAVTELLPFRNMTQAPPVAEWKEIPAEDAGTVIPGTQVYELSWTDTGPTETVQKKWRGYIDVNTKLPKRIEWSQKQTSEEKFRLTTVVRLDYPVTAEIETLKASF